MGGNTTQVQLGDWVVEEELVYKGHPQPATQKQLSGILSWKHIEGCRLALEWCSVPLNTALSANVQYRYVPISILNDASPSDVPQVN